MPYDYDVAVYLGSLPKIRNHNLKVRVMRAFAEGAKKCGARVYIDFERKLVNARLAVIIGWVGMNFSGPHIYFRRDIIEHQKKIGGKVMPIDGSCFKFSAIGDHWLRYSLDDVFYNTGFYANAGADSTKWDQIKQTLNLELKPWQTAGSHYLICLQRDSGWNAKGFDQQRWVLKTLKRIRAKTQKPIWIRPHPANKIDWQAVVKSYRDIVITDSINCSLHQDLADADAAIFFNSSSSVASVLAGVPVFVDDESAVTYNVANHNLKSILQPVKPDRTQWLNELSAAHWTLEQSCNGDIYRHFEPYLPT